MKKSEMVNFMSARYDFYSRKYPGVPLDLIMLYVLKGMEAAGMVPPRHPDRSNDLDVNPKGYEWEPEDGAE